MTETVAERLARGRAAAAAEKRKVVQVWICKSEKCDFRYETPIRIFGGECGRNHPGTHTLKLVEGDPAPLPKPRKAATASKAPAGAPSPGVKIVQRRSAP